MEQILAIAQATFRESIRSKVLYSLLFCAFALVAAATIFGAVTIGDQVKVIKDFGLFAVSLFSVAYAVIGGATLLQKELAKKTIYNILSKSVQRYQFILGKYLGMLATASLLLLLMGGALLIFVGLLEGRLEGLLVQAYFCMFLELAIVCAAAIFFSSIVVTPLLSGLFTFGVFLVGRSTEELLYFVKAGTIKGALAQLLDVLYVLLPNLQQLNISNQIVYGVGASPELLGWGAVYALAYSGILLWLANLFFSRRDFN